MVNKQNLHEGHRKRLKQRLLDFPESLSDHGLLELLLFYSIPRRNTNDISHQVLDRFSDFKSLFSSENQSYLTVPGIGENSAVLLQIVASIIKRYQQQEKEVKPIFSFSRAPQLIKQHFEDDLFDEKLFIFLLDSSGKLLYKMSFCDKSSTHVTLDTSQVSKAIATCNPRFAYVAHNHPSGNTEPTEEDDITTGKLNVLFALHGVTLVDHVIISKHDSYSYYLTRRLDTIRKNYNIDKILKDVIDK